MNLGNHNDHDSSSQLHNHKHQDAEVHLDPWNMHTQEWELQHDQHRTHPGSWRKE